MSNYHCCEDKMCAGCEGVMAMSPADCQKCEHPRDACVCEPDANCVTTPDGGCIGGPCMHDTNKSEPLTSDERDRTNIECPKCHCWRWGYIGESCRSEGCDGIMCAKAPVSSNELLGRLRVWVRHLERSGVRNSSTRERMSADLVATIEALEGRAAVETSSALLDAANAVLSNFMPSFGGSREVDDCLVQLAAAAAAAAVADAEKAPHTQKATPIETPVHRKWPGEPPHCPSCDCGIDKTGVRPTICYYPCAAHLGIPWTMTVGWSPPIKSVCPICEPPTVKATAPSNTRPLLEVIRDIHTALGVIAPSDFKDSAGRKKRAVEAAWHLADNAIYRDSK